MDVFIHARIAPQLSLPGRYEIRELSKPLLSITYQGHHFILLISEMMIQEG